MEKIKFEKKIALLLCLILIGIVLVPITQAEIKNTGSNYSISVNYLGLKNKSTNIDLTNTEYTTIKKILDTLESDLRDSKTKLEANFIIEDALETLYQHRLFGKININLIKRLCVPEKILNTNILSPLRIDSQFTSIGGDNAFCILLSHIKGYVYDHGLFFILAVLVALSSLPFIIIFYPIGVVFNFISDAIFSLQNKKPFIPPFPHRVETRYNESYSNLISRGLYGRVDNDYTNWGFRFDAFTGVRINLGRDDTLRVNESYYLGSALFVSWNYDGPH